MTKAHNVDAQRLSFILNELRLPAIKVIWPEFTGSVAKIVKLEHAWRRLDGRNDDGFQVAPFQGRSEEHTSELQSLMRISYAVFCLKKKTKTIDNINK